MYDETDSIVERARDCRGVSGDPNQRIDKSRYRKGPRQDSPLNRYENDLLEGWLRFMYAERKFGVPTIAQRLDISETTTYRLLERYGIRIRPQHVDVTGKVFGKLTVVSRVGTDRDGKALWSCRCACGNTHLATYGLLKSGHVRSCGCLRKTSCTLKNNCNWKGGRMYGGNGYIRVKAPDSPMADKAGYVAEHKYVMSKIIGRPLRKDEIVHHKNGQRNDNRAENLELWSTSHPAGQRISDKTAWAIEWLTAHAPDKLASSSA